MFLYGKIYISIWNGYEYIYYSTQTIKLILKVKSKFVCIFVFKKRINFFSFLFSCGFLVVENYFPVLRVLSLGLGSSFIWVDFKYNYRVRVEFVKDFNMERRRDTPEITRDYNAEKMN